MAVKQLEAEENAAEDERLARLSLEELELEKLQLAKRAIQADPTLAIRAAADLGWTVRPPEQKELDSEHQTGY